MKNADLPAMPLPLGSETVEGQQGLTKREMMAMHILSAMNGNPMPWLKAGVNGVYMAKVAIGTADALLTELERTKCQS